MASGVKMCDEAIEMFKSMKLRKLNIRYLMLAIDQKDGLIKVVNSQEKSDSLSQQEEYNAFLDQLPSDNGRYCIMDLTVPQKNGAKKDIMYVITWCPDSSPTKSKMLYTTSKKALIEKVGEGLIEKQATDLGELNYEEVMERGCK